MGSPAAAGAATARRGGGGEHFSLSLPLCPWARESRCLRGCHCPSWASTLWQGSLGLGLLRGPRAAAAQPPTRRPPCRQSSGTKCPPAREAEAGPDQWPAHFSTKGQRVHIFNLLGSRQLCRRGRAAPTPGGQCRPARSCANKTSLTRSGSGLLLAWSAHPRLQAQNPAGDGERTAEVGRQPWNRRTPRGSAGHRVLGAQFPWRSGGCSRVSERGRSSGWRWQPLVLGAQ